ncbi:hypothetical protein MKW98_000138 [Papaver atlanticum]|uniref:Mei2-like C-terminal RNA recognition motif domain-containing protein n=1 Tax=Papaver atlanticum TaxID=357466 RepID=A0AAD4SS17_9MAGN|nr:hypothetical protein MKW98_000138 [Papaver atlanticum]
MEKLSDHKKKGRRIMTKKPKNTKSKVTRKPKPSLSTNNSKRTRRPSSSIPFGSGTRFVPRQHHHQVKMIEDNHGSSYNKYSSKHEVVNDTSSDENRKALRMLYQDDHQDDNSSLSESTTLSEYDFLYLPIDFKRKGNYGYAFLNFTTPVAAMRFYNAFNNFSWKDSIYQSPKVCKICPAKIQGKDELVKRFKNSYFDCDTDEFLPVSFSPPRNGSTPDSFPSLVGKRPKIPRKRVIDSVSSSK